MNEETGAREKEKRKRVVERYRANTGYLEKSRSFIMGFVGSIPFQAKLACQPQFHSAPSSGE